MDFINRQYTFIGEHYRQQQRKQKAIKALKAVGFVVVFIAIGLVW